MNSSLFQNQIAGLFSHKSSPAAIQARCSARPRLAGACAALAATLTVAAATLASATIPAEASVFNYGSAGSAHTVNAGILQLDSAGQISAGQFPSGVAATSGALYTFYVLDQRTDYKPAGWRFVNPLAPATVTSDIQAIFGAAYSTLGQQITPNMAAYWMVNLPSITSGYVPGAANPLAQYDILVIRAADKKVIGLSRAERELLRDYVDQGGTLWIEDAGGATTQVQDDDLGADTTSPAGLFVDVDFNDSATLAGAPYVSDSNHRHPTLTVPNFLTVPELSGLSYGYSGALPYYLSSQAGIAVAPDPDFLSIVVGNSLEPVSSTAQPVISAGDYGSGHVVIDDCNILGGISDAVVGSATDTGFAPTNLAPAQPSDLQYAYNVISWSGAESTTDGGDVRHTGAQTTADIGSSLLSSWLYPDPNNNPNNVTVNGIGVAISGNIAYVTSTDRIGNGSYFGTLHAFDINPAEDLDQDDNPDDGNTGVAGTTSPPVDPTTTIPYIQDFSAGLNYDELWADHVTAAATTSTPTLSAPVIASLPAKALGLNSSGYSNAVLVEDQSGNVYVYDATSNPELANPISQPILSGSKTIFSGIVPSPVYSHGWLIAPQPPTNATTGSTVMLAYFGGGSANPPQYIEQLVNNSGAQAATDITPVISTPAVAMVPSLDTKYGGTDIVAYVATQEAVYPQFLGSRDEEVEKSSLGTFETKVTSLGGGAVSSTGSPLQGVTALVGAPEDAYQKNDDNFFSNFFSYLSDNPSWIISGTAGLERVPNFRGSKFGTGTNTLELTIDTDANDGSPDNAYTDYDVVPGGKVGGTAASATASILSRHQILAEVNGNATKQALPLIQGIAVGDDDTLYMTVNEPQGAYIEAVQEQNPMLNSTSANGTLIKWRYSIGNNSSYAPSGLNTGGLTNPPQFIGAPVVDRNHVYALALDNGQQTAQVLCFNHDANFTLVTGTISEGSVTLQQTDENGMPSTLEPSQYNITDSQTGTVAITDFAPQATSVYEIWPNLSVSIPITTNLGDSNPSNTSASISSDSNGSSLLAWYSTAIPLGTLPTGKTPGPLREFGSYLYFTNGLGSFKTTNASGTTTTVTASQLSSVSNDNGGITPNPNVVPSIQLNSTTFTDGALAASGTSVVGAGDGGIVGMAYTGTMVADSSRLIEYAPDGSPMWALDSTTQQSPVLDNSTSPATTTEATTNVSLSRPSSVTLLADNDILFADTGNNRCVRVDRGGNVLWELNSFNDPTGLLAPGQPLTLNDPTSVVEWRDNVTSTGSTDTETVEHYLVADAGNYRVVEIDDIYTNGNIDKTNTAAYHILRWVSHTFDKAGRNYRYTYATRYYNSNKNATNPTGILVGVANRQIAPLVVNSSSASPYLETASRDTPGSSIALLTYYPTTIAPVSGVYQALAYTASPTTTGNVYANPANGLPFGLFNQIEYLPTTTSANPVTIPIRNLRYVSAYFPTGQTGQTYTPGENIVLCDDDGVFDGVAYGNSQTATYSIVAVPNATVDSHALHNTVGFSFTKADYDTLASIGTAAPKDVFTPTSAQRLDSGDYLITNGASSGDATPQVNSTNTVDVANNLLHFGGDVIEVSGGTTKAQVGVTFGRTDTSPSQTSGNNVSTTAPLSLPAYAVRSR